ncbi:response regulator [Alteromonas sediminis]|uniref:Response regulator n=1 Tax=Alteromonas sediminis TaxID=2259342 RepID=A0A3N5Z6V4_9ALTE|nr:response regulator [Alteromonas sediminis]RPJ66354.1 response regulator [Alteromonas sediminis]
MTHSHVLIIDDDKQLTTMLDEFLRTNGYEVSVANDGQEGLDRLNHANHYDVVLLDVMMPVKDGFDVLREMRHFCFTPVIMLTARGDDYDRILGLELGADDYLPKPFNHRELMARIKALIRRRTHYDDSNQALSIEIGEISIHASSQKVTYCGQQLELTGTEFATLFLLAKQAGHLVSKAAISEQVLGRKLMEFDRSIDMHVSNIRKKLAAINDQPTIKTVRGAGYILLCP